MITEYLLSEKEKFILLKFIRDFCKQGVTVSDLFFNNTYRNSGDAILKSGIKGTIPKFIISEFITSFSSIDIMNMFDWDYYDHKELLGILCEKYPSEHTIMFNRIYEMPLLPKCEVTIDEFNFLLKWSGRSPQDISENYGYYTTECLKRIGLSCNTAKRIVERIGRLPWKYKELTAFIPWSAYILTSVPEEVLDFASDDLVDWKLLSSYQDIPLKYIKSKLYLLDINGMLDSKYLSKEKKEYIEKLLEQ